MGEQEIDPHCPRPPYTYECVACAIRIEADRQPATCPECGARMRDISVPRE
jgi:predicted nucleic acid-binding Zn ribbon protein